MVNDAGEGVSTRVNAMSDDDSGPDPSELVGRSIAGKFVVEALIATGGAGTVYRARQLALDRVVALKVLRQDIARDRYFVERFKREARAASRLDHPNSVRVFDFGHIDDSLLYLAMEYVEGKTLHNVIADEWPLGDARIVDLMSQMLSAVAVAHDMEVIHRDLKPDNIMILPATSDDGEATELAKVCDFGIATLGAVQRDGGGGQAGGPWATMDGSLIGTPGYMSPEQARGEQADRRSDIYSAGVILYHMLAGRPPFDGESAYQVAMKHITDPPLPPSTHAAVGAELEAVCLRALSKSPEDRFDSARAMRAALRAALARSTPAGQLAAARGLALDATPMPQPKGPSTIELLQSAGLGRAARRRRTVATALGVTAAAIVAVGFAARSLLVSGRDRARPPTAVAMPAPAPPPEPAPVAAAVAPSPIEAAHPPAVPPPAERPARTRQTRERALVRATRLEAKAAAPVPAPVSAPVAAATPAPAPTPAQPPVATPPPVAAVAPTPQRIDIERATASITAVTTTSAIPGSNIRAALARAPLVRCYREALHAGGLASATATLRLRIDIGGYVTGATLLGAGIPPALKACVEKAATALRVKDVDTGDATADVALSFIAAP